MSVRYLFLDEIDAYPPDADSEGDPLTLAIQRTSTFARRKIFIVSTPTIQGLSRIEKEFVNSAYKVRKLKRGIRLWTIGVSIIKSEIYSFLKKRQPTDVEDKNIPHGYMHFPEYNTEYFKQLTAEQLVTRIVKGHPKREWQKTRERNEALDCRVYVRAAAIALGIDRWNESKWWQLSEHNPTKLITEHPQKDHYELPSPMVHVRKDINKRPKIIRSSWI